MNATDKRQYDDQDDLHVYMLNERGEPAVCKIFGCGRTLSLHEQLHGDCCTLHNSEKNWNQTIRYYSKSSATK